MPIKFRCHHCRQFLGISRAKAGEVFDCPTCGWTLRVPDLDGTVRPLPDPGLDMGDSKLAKALDELASMENPVLSTSARSAANSAGGTGVEGRVIDDRKDEDDDGALERVVGDPWKSGERKSENSPAPNAGIQTMAEPIELPPLPAPEPVDVGPRFRARKPIRPDKSVQQDNAKDKESDSEDDSSSGARPWRSTAQGGNSWKRLLAAAEFGVTEGDSTDEPVKEAEPAVGPASVNPDAAPSIAATTVEGGPKILVVSGPLIWAAIGIGAVIFSAGFWIGRVTTLPEKSTSIEVSATTSGLTEGQPEQRVGPAENRERRNAAFRGRLTFRTEEGERKADRSARVIVLPVDRKGTAKLSVAGLRSGDEEADQLLAATTIRTLGGDLCTTDESGEFEIRLPGSGQFYILALSNSVLRDDAVNATEIEDALARYFERPAQLLGRVMYHFEEVRYSGDGVTPWDYSFSQP